MFSPFLGEYKARVFIKKVGDRYYITRRIESPVSHRSLAFKTHGLAVMYAQEHGWEVSDR